MFMQRPISAPHNLWRMWAEIARKVQALRERHKTIGDIRKARGITLLREWLSPDQQAQFDAFRYLSVVTLVGATACTTGTGTNVHEIDAAGRPIIGWCFVPSGELVAGDVMLAQKIALETNELAALAVANRFPVERHGRSNLNAVPRRAY